MKHPARIDLPFFAYGLFKPGQLAFFQLRDLITGASEPASVKGRLLLRDGLPIIDPEGEGFTNGAVLIFRPERTAEAYDRISNMEPDKQYRWGEIQANGHTANVLVGRSPGKGSVPCEESDWNGWSDPLFTAALEVVEETLQSQDFDWNLKPLFRLQMAYLLLWSSIERYLSLRYHLGDKVLEKVRELAGEPAFVESFRRHVTEDRRVYRADRPRDNEVLDPKSPETSLTYYYQVRSNITHRGKGVVWDYEHVKNSLAELLPIFRDVLKEAERDAGA